MVGMIIKVVVGLLLFAGSLVGGLAATGRLNHEGTANIPLLGALFPEPEKEEGEEGEQGHEGDAHGHAAADGDAHGGHPADASHAGESGVHEAGHDSDDPQEPKKPRRSKVGKSVVEPEKPAGGGHGGHGGGHGDDGHGGGHGDDGHGGGHGDDAHGGGHGDGHGDDGHGKSSHGDAHKKHGHGHGDDHAQKHMSPAERDFDNVQRALRSQGKTGYKPGALFRFDGMPSGLTPEQLNEAWQRVQGVMQEVELRRKGLDLRERELGELADDISRRWKELGEERLQIEQMQRALDQKIQKFERTVKLVRKDEEKLLKRNAETLAAFERSKAAELVQQQWKTERGQDEVLRLLEFMDKDAVNEILAELPNAMVQDVLKQRLRVSKEAKASAPPR